MEGLQQKGQSAHCSRQTLEPTLSTYPWLTRPHFPSEPCSSSLACLTEQVKLYRADWLSRKCAFSTYGTHDLSLALFTNVCVFTCLWIRVHLRVDAEFQVGCRP